MIYETLTKLVLSSDLSISRIAQLAGVGRPVIYKMIASEESMESVKFGIILKVVELLGGGTRIYNAEGLDQVNGFERVQKCWGKE